MSYAEIKPQYYQMHMPDSPWHAGSEGWKSAPWPSFYPNPNLVGPPRLAVEGLGAFFRPQYEKPISGVPGVSGLGAYFKPVYEKPIAGLGAFPQRSTYRPVDGIGACPCSARGVGADAPSALRWDIVAPIAVIASITGLALYYAQKK